MDSRLSRWCEGLIEAGWLVAILIIPLYFNIHSDRIFEPDKIALLRSIALVMIAGWLIRWLDRRGWRQLDDLRWTNPQAIWHKPFVVPILLLVAIYLVATLFSVTPRISWAGSYQRLQGTYTTLSYIVIFALMAGVIRKPEQVSRVVTVAILASIPVSLYGLLQHYGHDPLPWGGNVQNRVSASLGNAIFISAYLIMVVPLTLARVVDSFGNILNDDKLATADIVRSSVYIFILAIQFLSIYWSGSRGPLIGLGVGLFSFMLVLLVSLRDTGKASDSIRVRDVLPALFVLLPAFIALLTSRLVAGDKPIVGFIYFFGIVALTLIAVFILAAMRRGRTWLWLGWILLTVFMAGWLLLFNISLDRSSAYRDIPFVGGVVQTLDEWRDLPVIGSYGRMLDPTNTTGREKSGRVRVLIWEGVVDLLTPHEPLTYPDGQRDPFNWLRPLIGYGPESMYVVYNSFYPPELATVESRNASPDRSHNETFDALIITGLAGFIAWQAIYLSAIYFAFRYLGVVRSKRDRWMLVGLWIGGALLASIFAVVFIDPIYLGVAVPTGIILSVVVYLIYYALFSYAAIGDEPASQSQPSPTDRLLMNGLVAAVLAHYVEIHFGIAISATRLYFFVFLGLMFALGLRSKLSAVKASDESVQVTSKPDKERRRGATGKAPPTQVANKSRRSWSELVLFSLLMMLMIGVLGYGFLTYALPPGKVITGPLDLSTTEIVRQALLQNVRQNFIDWPFVFSMIVLSWLLGWVVILSEMAKHNQLFSNFARSIRTPDSRRFVAAGLLVVLAVAGVSLQFLIRPTTATGQFGASLATITAIPMFAVALLLALGKPSAVMWGGLLGAGLAIVSLPIFFAGLGKSIAALLPGVLLALAGALVLWLLWDSRWRATLLPATGLILASFAGGMTFIYLHAIRYRAILFYRPATEVVSPAELRALEAIQTGSLLVGIYLFLFLIMVLIAFALEQTEPDRGRQPVTNIKLLVAFGSIAIFFGGAVFLSFQVNFQPVQADMIYKRAKPFDDLASRVAQVEPSGRLEAWDAAIAIYNEAIRRVPDEDFYYLFQGRALLERAGITPDAGEKSRLLDAAERLLIKAQAINPLNTDHTANLARLNTRWFAAVDDPAEKQERLALAESYYQAALKLSPQNAIIRNEYARLVLELRQDCSQALALFDEAVQIDPYFVPGHLARADAYLACADDLSPADKNDYYERASTALDQALQLDPTLIRGWVQLAEIRRQMGDPDSALAAAEQASTLNDPVVFPPHEIYFLLARIHADRGDTAQARTLAESALATATGDTAVEIEAFLDGLAQEQD